MTNIAPTTAFETLEMTIDRRLPRIGVEGGALERGRHAMLDNLAWILRKLIRGIIVSNDHADIDPALIQGYIDGSSSLRDHLMRSMCTFLSGVYEWTRIADDATFEEKVRDMQRRLPELGARFSRDLECLLQSIAGHLLGRGRYCPFKHVFSPGHNNTGYIASRMHLDPRGQEELLFFAELVASFLRGQRNPAAVYRGERNGGAAQYARGMLQVVLELAPRPINLGVDFLDEWTDVPGMPGGIGDETEPLPTIPFAGFHQQPAPVVVPVVVLAPGTDLPQGYQYRTP